MPVDAAIDSPPPDGPPCPPSYVRIGSNAYRDAGFMAVTNTQSICEADGAHIVIIDDVAERDAILALGTSVNDYWLGFGSNAAGEYVTDLGVPQTYLPWSLNQPSATPMGRGVMASRMTTRPGDFYLQGAIGSGHMLFCECEE